jgi:hypothetical protein
MVGKASAWVSGAAEGAVGATKAVQHGQAHDRQLTRPLEPVDELSPLVLHVRLQRCQPDLAFGGHCAEVEPPLEV